MQTVHDDIQGKGKPGYLLALLALLATGELVLEPGGEMHVLVEHDDGCSLLLGRGGCDCLPELHVRR